MSEHPTVAELRELVWGGLSAARGREILRHLLRCSSCRCAVAPYSSALSSEAVVPPNFPQEGSSAYDIAIDRAFAAANQERRKSRQERNRIDKAVAILAEKGVAGYVEAARHLSGVSTYRALLEHSQALRYDDPRQMVLVAELAVHLAGQLSSKRHSIKQLADFRCRALVELGNAYRVADRLDDAARTLAEAAEAFLQGSGDELLEARLCNIRASLYADRRLFNAAAEALDTVYAIHWRQGDRHSAGRALIKKGIYTGYDSQPEEAIRILRRGLGLIDRKEHPDLVFMAVHAQINFLLEAGRPKEARALLWQCPLPSGVIGGRVSLLKRRWLEAKIEAALGPVDRAEQGYLEVRQGFEEVGLPYSAALSGLELVTLWMKQKRTAEAQSLVGGLVQMFQALQIHREALAALLLLHKAMEEGVKPYAILDQVVEFLKHAEGDPAVTFAGWFLSS